MGFTNTIIGGAAALIRAAIKSPNFVHGSTGWSINKDGTAEFQSATIRGTLTGSSAVFGTSGVGETTIDTAGNILLSGADNSQVIRMNPAAQRILIYNDPAGAGQLAMSIALNAGTDAFGNAYPAGVRVFTTPQNMPAMSNGWSISGHATYMLDALGNLVVSWKDLIPGTVTDGTVIWGSGSLPSLYQPANNRRIPCYTDNLKINNIGGINYTEGAALEIEPDGSVQCFGISLQSSRVDLFAVIPLSF